MIKHREGTPSGAKVGEADRSNYHGKDESVCSV